MVSPILKSYSAICLGFAALSVWGLVETALGQDWKKDWEKSFEEAKREGAIVAGIPARPELRKQLELIVDTKWLRDYGVRAAKGDDGGRIPQGKKPSGRQVHSGENSLGQIRRADTEIRAAGCPYQMTTSRSN